MVHSVFVIEFRNGSSVAFVETSDELLNHLTWGHKAVLFRSGVCLTLQEKSKSHPLISTFPSSVNWR